MHEDLLAGLGIATLVGVASLDAEGSQTSDLDPIATDHGAGHAVEDSFDGELDIALL